MNSDATFLTIGEKRMSVSEAKAAGIDLDEVVRAAEPIAQHSAEIRRRLLLWAADCAARVLPQFENQFPDDDRPRKAIEAARAFARGEIDAAAAADAADEADGAHDQHSRPLSAALAADAAAVAAYAAVSAIFSAAAVARRAATDAAAERVWQYDRLVQWLDGPEPEDINGAE